MNYLKKTAVATAIAGALGAGTSVASDGVFFPYISMGDTFTTLVSVINSDSQLYDKDGDAGVGSAFNRLHWVYHYKAGEDATNNEAKCDHHNVLMPSSKYDVQMVDLGGHFGDDQGSMFNDPTAVGSPGTFVMSGVGMPNRGYLLVHNADDSGFTEVPADSFFSISGEFLNIEYGSGATWGGQGLRMANFGDINEYDQLTWQLAIYSSIFNFWGPGGWLSQEFAFMPFDDVNTSFLVTPLAHWDAGSMFRDNEPSWALALDIEARNGQVAFDRNENAVFSGSEEQIVVCVGRVQVEDLFADSTKDAFPDGGWTNLQPIRVSGSYRDANGVRRARGATVFKLEYNMNGELDGTAVPGTWNNGNYLYGIYGWFTDDLMAAVDAEDNPPE